MNQNGLGTPKNIYRAIEKFFDAFHLGDVISAGEIAELCLELKCFSHALEFYQTAADGGDKYSMGTTFKLTAFFIRQHAI